MKRKEEIDQLIRSTVKGGKGRPLAESIRNYVGSGPHLVQRAIARITSRAPEEMKREIGERVRDLLTSEGNPRVGLG